jgi:hypothetical protein
VLTVAKLSKREIVILRFWIELTLDYKFKITK